MPNDSVSITGNLWLVLAWLQAWFLVAATLART